MDEWQWSRTNHPSHPRPTPLAAPAAVLSAGRPPAPYPVGHHTDHPARNTTARPAGLRGIPEPRAPLDALKPLDSLEVLWQVPRPEHSGCVTPEGAAWLASACSCPRGVAAVWSVRPTAPGVLPCGIVFDVVNLPALFGRQVLEQLWAAGPGSGPVAVHRGRVLLFAAPGTAQRLPSLLAWEEWGSAVPPLLCHGTGDAVTVPAPYAPEDADPSRTSDSGSGECPRTAESAPRWVVAPATASPWLPGPAVLLWACVRAARDTGSGSLASQVSAPEGP